jgi:hypothetical protein
MSQDIKKIEEITEVNLRKKESQKEFQKIPEEFIERKPEVTSDLVKLPSKGKLYPVTSSLHGADTIEIRHMTGLEEDILTTRSLLRSGKAIDKVLKNCILDKSVNIDDLIIGDKNAIMIALRTVSYGPEYQIEVECPSCGEKDIFEFDLSILEMNTLDIEPVEPGVNKFEFKLPVSDKTIFFKFLASGEDKQLNELQDIMRKKANVQVDSNVTSSLKATIVAVEGIEDKKVISDFCERIHVRDSKALRKYIDKVRPDVIMKQQFSCKSCGDSREVNVPITTEFFWPEE